MCGVAYTFTGWYTAPIGGEQITPDTVLEPGTKLYAQFDYIAVTDAAQIDYEIQASGYEGIYDGDAHGVSVSTQVEGAKIYFSDKELDRDGFFKEGTSESPTFTNAGEYTVWYCITAPHYKTVIDSLTVDITQAIGSNLTVSMDGWTYGSYDGSAESANVPTVSTKDPLFETAIKAAVGAGTVVYEYKPKDAEDDAYTTAVPTDAGTYTVRASITEMPDYINASAETDFTITPKEIGITWDVPDLTYTGKPQSVSASFPDGAVVDGDAGEELFAISLTDQTRTNAGDYTAQAELTGSRAFNYTLREADTTQDWSIAQKALTVTANDKTIDYNMDAENDGVVYDGFVDGEDETVLCGELAYAYTYEKGEEVLDYTKGCPAVDYSIVPSGLTADNYAITFVPGTLTVNSIGSAIENTGYALTYTYNGKAITAPTADDFKTTNTDADVEWTFTWEQKTGEDTCKEIIGPPTDAGNYRLTVSTSRTTNFDAETAVFDVTVKQAAVTVTAQDAAIIYGDAPVNNGIKDYTLIGDDKLSGELAYTYNYEQFGDIGAYTITPGGLSNPNYAITFESGTLTVSAKPVTLSWTNDTALTYNGKEQSVTAEIVGLVNEDAVTLTYTGSRAKIAGDYTAKAELSGDKAPNYTLTDAGQDWNIAKAKLTITAEDVNLVYGDVPADYRMKDYTLFEDDKLIGELTCTAAYEPSGNVGTYSIIPAGVSSPNYDITFVNGTLSVVPKPITITADNAEKIFGTADPALTFADVKLVGTDRLTGSLARAEGEDAGEYAITQGTLTAGDNYDITFVPAVFTIRTAQFPLEAKGYSGVYDSKAYGISASTNVEGAKVYGNTAQRTVRQMCRRFFVRLPNDDDAILYVSLGEIGQDDGKDANR